MNIYAFADEACGMIDGQIAAMQRNGLHGLEIRNVDQVNVSRISLDKAREVRQKLDDAGLITWSVGSPIGKINIETDDYPAHLETFRHVIDVARILDAKNIRLFSFYLPKNCRPEDYRGEVIDRLGAMLDLAAGSGVSLCHENEKGIYGDIASRCLQLHQALPGLKAIVDPANYIQCHQDPWEAWLMMAPYLQYLHIKDALADGSVVPAGAGIGHVKKIVDAYIASGGNNVTIEPHLTVFDGLSALEQAGDTSKVGTYVYPSSDAAFDAACQAFKNLL